MLLLFVHRHVAVYVWSTFVLLLLCLLISEFHSKNTFISFLTGVTGLLEMDEKGNREIDFALWDMTDTDSGVYQVASFVLFVCIRVNVCECESMCLFVHECE